MREGIKRRATWTVMANQQFLAEQLVGISEGVAINLPVAEHLCQNMRFSRQGRNFPPLPINIAAITVLPIEFQTTTSGDKFLLFEQFFVTSGAGAADRIIAFVSV